MPYSVFRREENKMGDTIARAAQNTGLTEYTLRYYEKEGLLPFVKRNASGYRSFRESDYEWIELIACLKKTGMEIKDIRQFIDWCVEGDSTLQKRLDLFKAQKIKAEQQLAELEQHIKKIEHKIRYYEAAVAAGTEAIHNGKGCE